MDVKRHPSASGSAHSSDNTSTYASSSGASTSKPVASSSEEGLTKSTAATTLARAKSLREAAQVPVTVSVKPTISVPPVRLAVHWSPVRKWAVCFTICLVQVSMNMNTSIYSNARPGVMDEFNISAQAFRVGAAVFLVMYAIGSLLWAPWSEEMGRKPVLQVSLLLVNIWQIPCALAPNYATLIIGRFFAGLCSAGGSVTLGTIADMWDSDDQQIAVIIVVFFSAFGASIGPIPGAYIEQYLNWRWVFWVQLIFGGFTQLVHFFLVPETRETVILEKVSKNLRKQGKIEEADIIQPEKPVLDLHHAMTIWSRPFEMFFCEPIVLLLSLLSGFSDALVFTFIEAFGKLYGQWNFTTVQLGWAFIPIIIGYVIAALSYYIFPIRMHSKLRRQGRGNELSPESRLWWLLYLGPLLPIGLFGVAWTSFGPSHTPWIAPMIFTSLFGMANYAIYMSSIDYMIASYGAFSSSATAGNAFARDGLAGAATMYAMPMFNALGLQWGTTLLAFVAVLVTIPIYVFYWKGPQIRARSKFASSLASEKVMVREKSMREASYRAGSVALGAGSSA